MMLSECYIRCGLQDTLWDIVGLNIHTLARRVFGGGKVWLREGLPHPRSCSSSSPGPGLRAIPGCFSPARQLALSHWPVRASDSGSPRVATDVLGAWTFAG